MTAKSIMIAWVMAFVTTAWVNSAEALSGYDQILFISEGYLSETQQCSVSFVEDPQDAELAWACTAAHCLPSAASEAQFGLGWLSLPQRAFQSRHSLTRDYACAPIRGRSSVISKRQPVRRALVIGESLRISGFPSGRVVQNVSCTYRGLSLGLVSEFFKALRLRPTMICSSKGLPTDVHGFSGAGVETANGEFAGTLTTARNLPGGGYEFTFAPADKIFDLEPSGGNEKSVQFNSEAPLLYWGHKFSGTVNLAVGDVVQSLSLSDNDVRVEGALRLGRSGELRFIDGLTRIEFGRLVVRDDGTLKCVQSSGSQVGGAHLCQSTSSASSNRARKFDISVPDSSLKVEGPLVIGPSFSDEAVRKELYPLGSPNPLVSYTSRFLSEIGYWDLSINRMPDEEVYKIVLFCKDRVVSAEDQVGCLASNIKQVLLTQVTWTKDGLDTQNADRSYCQSVIESVLVGLDLLNIPGLRAQRYHLWTAIEGNELPHVALELEAEGPRGQTRSYFYDPSFLPLKFFPKP